MLVMITTLVSAQSKPASGLTGGTARRAAHRGVVGVVGVGPHVSEVLRDARMQQRRLLLHEYGKLAEVLGPDYVRRDTFARTLKFRGNGDEEFKRYHPEGRVERLGSALLPDESPDTASGGVGLGLSIARRAIHLHHGTLTAENADPGLRILGVLALARQHGLAVVEDAAKAALDLGVLTYRFLRRYLDRRPPMPLTLRQVDPLIRQLTLYRDLIDRRTGDPQ